MKYSYFYLLPGKPPRNRFFQIYCIIIKDFAPNVNIVLISFLIFRDSYGNLYEQPFFLQQENLYEPRSITHKKYNIYTNPDTAIECFKKSMDVVIYNKY